MAWSEAEIARRYRLLYLDLYNFSSSDQKRTLQANGTAHGTNNTSGKSGIIIQKEDIFFNVMFSI
jgi:hypothetical protein